MQQKRQYLFKLLQIYGFRIFSSTCTIMTLVFVNCLRKYLPYLGLIAFANVNVLRDINSCKFHSCSSTGPISTDSICECQCASRCNLIYK